MLRLARCLLPALVCLLLFSACEEGVDPILDSDRNYSLWGVLDMARDTQFVRVVPIRGTLLPDDGPLDADVRLHDLDTGASWTLRDSVLTFGERTAHVFWARMRPAAGHRYRVEVVTPGIDEVTSAEVRVPARPDAAVFDEIVRSRVEGGTVVVTGEQTIEWRQLERAPLRVDHWYRFMPSQRLPFDDVRLPEGPLLRQDEQQALWRTQLDLRRDRLSLDTLVNVQGTPLAGLGMQLTMLDEAFVPPGGIFDAELQAQPGTLSNVEHGFGFVGVAGRFSVQWIFSTESAQRLGYLPAEVAYGDDAPPLQAGPIDVTLPTGITWW